MKPTPPPSNPDTTPHWRIPELFTSLTPAVLEKLGQYHRELLKFNQTLNLISGGTAQSADLTHFADCVLACQAILAQSKAQVIHDIGSGNGFPGVVMAILDPARKLVLIERDTRKAEFLKHLAAALMLKNVQVECKALEAMPDGSISCAVTRGFASIAKALLMCRKAFPVGGDLYHLKGDNWATELAEIPSQLCEFWDPSLLQQYIIPIKKQDMAVILTKKMKA